MASNNPTIFARLLRRYLPLESRRCLSSMVSKSQLSPEVVMSKKNRESCIKKLKLFPSSKINGEAKIAAVLVPLCTYKGELGLLYTLRSTKLSSDRGHVSFPGGMKDETDKNIEKTALRETWEELRIPESEVDIWSSSKLIGKKHLSVMPVFGYIGNVDPEKLEVNPHEVEEAFVISLKNLCDPKLFRYTQFRNGYTLPAFIGGKYRVWGFTAGITHMVMKALVPEVYKNEINMLPPLGNTTAPKKTKNQRPAT